MQDVAVQLATKSPTPMKGLAYDYELPQLAEQVQQAVLKEVASTNRQLIYEPRLQTRKANDLENWAEAEKKVITATAIPRLFRLNAKASRLRTNKGYTSLMVPFFDGTVQVSVYDLGGDGAAEIDWGCEFILHLDEGTGIRPLTKDIDFLCSLFRLTARQEAMVEKEGGGDVGVSRTSEMQ